jgi:hypothetical protein
MIQRLLSQNIATNLSFTRTSATTTTTTTAATAAAELGWPEPSNKTDYTQVATANQGTNATHVYQILIQLANQTAVFSLCS